MSELSKMTITERIAHFANFNTGMSWEVLGASSEKTLEKLFAEKDLPAVMRGEIQYLHREHPARVSSVSKIGIILFTLSKYSPF